MGNWQLEVGKMAMYMMFPVLTFHYFNQPQYFEEAVTKMKKELYPIENDEETRKIREQLREISRRSELEKLQQMQAKLQQ